MLQFKGLWNAGRTVTRRFGTRRAQQQQRYNSEDTQLLVLASSSSTLTQHTAYRPHSTRSGDRIFVDAERSQKHGWRFGVTMGAISTFVVFIINFVVTIWGSLHNQSNKGVLYEGDCEKVRQLNIGIHLIVNVLSTIILSSSNYCMQCLSAPTRTEIDEAHAKRIWLDIGVPSIHNLRKINRRRVILWCLLGISSLPLHLFYNSMVFSSISSNSYYAHGVSQSFIYDDECYNCGNTTETTNWSAIKIMHAKARNGMLQNMTSAECIQEYATMIQTNRRNVLLVANDDKFPPPSENRMEHSKVWTEDWFDARDAATPMLSTDSYGWICQSLADHHEHGSIHLKPCLFLIDQVKKAPDNWKFIIGGRRDQIQSFNVQYCLSEVAEPRCKLRSTLPIAILVTILNLFKAMLIFYTAFVTKENPLMNMGDAVASFLEKRDLTTKDMCLLSVHEIKKHKHYFPAGPREWEEKRRRWKDVTSTRRWAVTFIMFSIVIIVLGSLYAWGVSSLPDGQSRSLAALAQLGYGAIDPRTIIHNPAGFTIIQNVLVANIPQLILSFLYFSYNGLLTCMQLGYEWASYAVKRKGLRVSRSPSGAQRSSYFLQLPHRFALPIMLLSSLLHWMVSQSIFLVAVDSFDWDGSPVKEINYGTSQVKSEWTSCGYSPIAILITLIMGILMTISIVAFGFVPFKPGMNLAASNSAAISAACHIKGDEVDGYAAARGKLQWGVVGVGSEGVGHCSFSTQEVKMPEAGESYAG